MIGFAVAVSVIFGMVAGTRTAITFAQGTGTIEDARRIGLFAGLLATVAAGTLLALVYGVGWLIWLYCDWVLTQSIISV